MKATFSMFATLLLASAVITQAQQATPAPAATNYMWHAELVSLDQAAKTITVKAQVVGDTATDLKNFKAGDRVILHWSGFDNSASGVRGVMKYDAAQAAKEPFMLPVELVSPTPQNNYITIKLHAPDSAATALKAVKPGEWVTFTSKHRPAGDADTVVAIRPYVQSSQS